PNRIARAWITLMKRLGYDRFVAQGGDWGALVTDQIGVEAPPELLGIHVNMPGSVPAEVEQAIGRGESAPAGLPPDEKRPYDQLAFFLTQIGYAQLMGTRPQTLTGLADSPVGLAAFMIDHDAASYALISRTFDGQTEGLSRDDVLDNVTLFWLT